MDESEKEQILKTVAYHCNGAGSAFLNFPKSKALKIIEVSKDGDVAKMGGLCLPLRELLQNIMGELDFKSLGAMRCLNIQRKAIMGWNPAYRDITAFAHEALRGLSCTCLLVHLKSTALTTYAPFFLRIDSALRISIHGSKEKMEKNVALGIRLSSAFSRPIRS